MFLFGPVNYLCFAKLKMDYKRATNITLLAYMIGLVYVAGKKIKGPPSYSGGNRDSTINRRSSLSRLSLRISRSLTSLESFSSTSRGENSKTDSNSLLGKLKTIKSKLNPKIPLRWCILKICRSLPACSPTVQGALSLGFGTFIVILACLSGIGFRIVSEGE